MGYEIESLDPVRNLKTQSFKSERNQIFAKLKMSVRFVLGKNDSNNEATTQNRVRALHLETHYSQNSFFSIRMICLHFYLSFKFIQNLKCHAITRLYKIYWKLILGKKLDAFEINVCFQQTPLISYLLRHRIRPSSVTHTRAERARRTRPISRDDSEEALI